MCVRVCVCVCVCVWHICLPDGALVMRNELRPGELRAVQMVASMCLLVYVCVYARECKSVHVPACVRAAYCLPNGALVMRNELRPGELRAVKLVCACLVYARESKSVHIAYLPVHL